MRGTSGGDQGALRLPVQGVSEPVATDEPATTIFSLPDWPLCSRGTDRTITPVWALFGQHRPGHTGLFVPKPTRDAMDHRTYSCDLLRTVRGRPPTSAGVSGRCYSLSYSLRLVGAISPGGGMPAWATRQPPSMPGVVRPGNRPRTTSSSARLTEVFEARRAHLCCGLEEEQQMGSPEVIAALIGLAGVAFGSAATYLQQRATRAENWRHDRETRWDQDRRATYVRLLMATDEVYRSVDFQDEDELQMTLVGSQRSIALAASDAVYRAHTEVLLMRQSPDVQKAADKLSAATGALYEAVRVAKPGNTSERQEFTNRFRDLNSQRREARNEFLDAAARELQIRQ